MWLVVSKVLGYLLSPLPFSVMLIVGGTLFSGLGLGKTGRFFKVSGFLLLFVSSMPVVERSLKSGLQDQYPPVEILESPVASMIVVLGGTIAMPSPPRLEVELHESSDRVLHAFRLYQAGKAPVIFLSAGNLFSEPKMKSEAFYISSLLQEWGVPPEAIVSEGDSRTTHENALQTLRFLEARSIVDTPVLLVTSASHMPRAMAVFRQSGINAIASTTDVSAGPGVLTGIFDFLPSVGALKGVTSAWHEYLGTWVYRARGWL
jgi:uncharacterized SAM-binding protein YcdF (DUF218 family)